MDRVKQGQEVGKPVANSAKLLGTPRYGAFWTASLLSNMGTWMQSVAEPWLVLSIGGSAFLVGLDAFGAGGILGRC